MMVHEAVDRGLSLKDVIKNLPGRREWKPLVYVAGPYSHPDPVENTNTAIRWGDRLMGDSLVVPLIPHLSLAWHFVSPHPETFWYEYDLHLLMRCNALLRIPGMSTGADMEVGFANDHDIPVFYGITSLYRWARDEWA